MVNFAELQQLDVGGLVAFADRWLNVHKALEETRGRFGDDVLRPMRAGAWEGDAAVAAGRECGEIERDIAAVAKQAKALSSYIDETVAGGPETESLQKQQARALELQYEAIAKGMTVSTDGRVQWSAIRAPGAMSDEEKMQADQKNREAAEIEAQIQEALRLATQTDDEMSKILKVIFGTTANFDTEDRAFGSDRDEWGVRDVLTEQKLEFVHDFMGGTKKWEEASELLRHYLDGSGEPFQVDAQRMLSDIPQFRKDVDGTLDDVRSGPDGTFSTGWQDSAPNINDGDSSLNWYYGLNHFEYRVVGEKNGDEIAYHVEVQKRYDWGTPSEHRSDVERWPVHLEQADIAHLNSVGMARDFDVQGKSGELKAPA